MKTMSSKKLKVGDNFRVGSGLTAGLELYDWTAVELSEAESTHLGQLVEAFVDVSLNDNILVPILERRIPSNYSPVVFRNEFNRIVEILFTRTKTVQEFYEEYPLSEFKKTVFKMSKDEADFIMAKMEGHKRLLKKDHEAYLELVWDDPEYAARKLFIIELLLAQKKITPEMIAEAHSELFKS